MAEMLQLLDLEIKTTMMNMLRTLRGKVNKIKEPIDNVNKEWKF